MEEKVDNTHMEVAPEKLIPEAVEVVLVMVFPAVLEAPALS